ncbi:hypothetical protein HanRHA438_Chr15g0703251 [Helianthus annuus]|uniref:Uncharacterized protein n=1 Tax=Helianthus annuus TaxID=4232 RepID=A0A9K3DZU5_HELAN|nr:hypothetical protein HanXRQr2_Chr15g0690831 [Helianthus annuus]KAJ0451020.1 hypothetical protein HanHA300_Chr15g0562861 [Helianthus annuus]KAJ0472881.1 hypothetical protein HanHA89_Chr15g0612081 [Helianthus annuus]KAJ0648484.1 hypothetical protein HanLR1_Chr15g0573461 [Helianthus annuus]KAJ0652314.1 hypothetical protein HanOQP8_Chr15g0570801 [Helianthus annuus]
MIGGSILVTSRLQVVVLRMVDFGGVTTTADKKGIRIIIAQIPRECATTVMNRVM